MDVLPLSVSFGLPAAALSSLCSSSELESAVASESLELSLAMLSWPSPPCRRLRRASFVLRESAKRT
eukprot:9504001-Pyramimonas_sp.AAC.6